VKYNYPDKQDLVTNIFRNAIINLAEDRQLPRITNLFLSFDVVSVYIAAVSILKEVIEILFQEGLIKVLLATETFEHASKDCCLHCSEEG